MADALARGQLDDAYWWARKAILQVPKYRTALNTLGVIYRRHGNLLQAELAFRHVLEQQPGNFNVMSNLARVLNDQGRSSESQQLTLQLERLQPYPPFHFFNLGQAAMLKGDYRTAKDMFVMEVERAAYNHEFHFWLALAHLGLGEIQQARDQISLALENSTVRKDHDLYAAKLERINAYRTQ